MRPAPPPNDAKNRKRRRDETRRKKKKTKKPTTSEISKIAQNSLSLPPLPLLVVRRKHQAAGCGPQNPCPLPHQADKPPQSTPIRPARCYAANGHVQTNQLNSKIRSRGGRKKKRTNAVIVSPINIMTTPTTISLDLPTPQPCPPPPPPPPCLAATKTTKTPQHPPFLPSLCYSSPPIFSSTVPVCTRKKN